MAVSIKDINFVNPDTINTYNQIDGLKVIEDLLLFKGVEIATAGMCVPGKFLDDMALVSYGLKSNSTNKLYVGMHLDRFYHRAGLVLSGGKIRIPKDIYNKVKEINDKYKTTDNQNTE